MTSPGVRPRRVRLLAELLLAVAYPFLVHVALRTNLDHLAGLGLVVVGLLLFPWSWPLRGSAARPGSGRRALLAGVQVAAGSLAWLDHSRLLLIYPLAINLALFSVFFSSLFTERPLVEALARLRDPELDAAKLRHCRRATEAWAWFFLLNGGVVLALAFFAPLDAWTLYTGGVSYALAALLGSVELLVRVRRFGVETAGPLGRGLLFFLRPLVGVSGTKNE